jgi:hypothetical protein
MKSRPLRRSIIYLCLSLVACSKSSHEPAVPIAPTTSIYFTVNDSTVNYPQNLAYIQDVDSVHTTLISGQFSDTSSKQGSLAIRVLSDTTGRFNGSNLLVTYTDGVGNVYYNSTDTTNFVELDKYPKSYNGVVSGSFSIVVTGQAGTVTLSRGSIIALYQQ